MSEKIQEYINAATRDNTRKSYQAAVEHFEVTWGGFLPATADAIANYLACYAGTLSTNTLRQRLAALAAWHLNQGFPDPTKTPYVKKVLKGIAELHPHREKRARPLAIEDIATLVAKLEIKQQQHPQSLQPKRDKAIVLIGFWRAFRSDELSRMQVEHVEVAPQRGMTIFLPRSKTDRRNLGAYHRAPSLKKLCPVEAYLDWVHSAKLRQGPVFRRINRWGRLSDSPLHPSSIINILRKLCLEAELENSDSYSSHSLRRGFANWANQNQWNMKELMDYVGWKDVQSAMRYLDNPDDFKQAKIESSLNLAAPPTFEDKREH